MISLVDTNLLVYATDETSFFHQSTHRFFELIISKEKLSLSIQNLTEFFTIVTNPKRVRSPLTQEKAIKSIKALISSGLFQIIIPKQQTAKTIIHLLNRQKIKSSEIHDIHLAAVMIDNNVSTIYTADTSIFKRLGLNAINPLK